MYERKTQGWLKHIDFILLDILCLHAAFLLAYITRHGLLNPYVEREYLNLAAIYTLVDILVLVANQSLKNVLKRGYYKELEQTVCHVFYVTALVALYLFSVQAGSAYSRITFFLLAVYYVVLAYGARLFWKKFLMKKKMELCRAAVYFVTTKKESGICG